MLPVIELFPLSPGRAQVLEFLAPVYGETPISWGEVLHALTEDLLCINQAVSGRRSSSMARRVRRVRRVSDAS